MKLGFFIVNCMMLNNAMAVNLRLMGMSLVDITHDNCIFRKAKSIRSASKTPEPACKPTISFGHQS